MLNQISANNLFKSRFNLIREEAQHLEAVKSQLTIKHQGFTALFNRVNQALESLKEATRLMPQTTAEMGHLLADIFKEVEPVRGEVLDTISTVEEEYQPSSNPFMSVARELLPNLISGEKIRTTTLSSLMTREFNGSDAEGKWQSKDAYECLEMSQLLWLKEAGKDLISRYTRSEILREIERIHQLCPTQTRRSEESIRLQQFSTPLPLAYVASVAAGITSDDVLLEPSSGTGILAAFGMAYDARLILNEICPKRRSILGQLFPDTPLFDFNAEQIHDYLAAEYAPTVVLMNPPFSASPKMAKRNPFATLNHISSALARLSEGGRLVIITADWFSPLNLQWRSGFIRLQREARLVFSAGVEGRAYSKHGTTIDTRLTVFDKVPATSPESFDNCFDPLLSISDLLQYVEQFVPSRETVKPITVKEAGARVKEAEARLELATREVEVPKTTSIAGTRKLRPSTKGGVATGISFDDVVEVVYSVAEARGETREMSDSLYETYESETIAIQGAMKHPSPLVQSAAMASVAAPLPGYRPRLPQRLITDGILSHPQLESVIYAGESHAKFLKGYYLVDYTLDSIALASEDTPGAVRFRRGYFIGSSTGAGKGRQVSAILLDNYLQGRKKGVWISKSETLLEDARRDWTALGGHAEQVVPLSRFRQGESIGLPEGIIFATYATLRTEAKEGKRSRVEQLIDWCGKDFEGVIVFDEAHSMKTAVSERGDRGVKKASLQGVAGLRLQHALPGARVLYVSATGATNVSNLAYAQRLGLWMSGEFHFNGQADFVAEMERGGIAALEVVSRDLKALGLYTALSLSYEGVRYEMLEHELTPEQIEIYDSYAEAFEIIHKNLEDALKATNITSRDGRTRNRNAKSAARSAFESNKQRFLNHLITSMKCPTLIRAIEKDIADGHAVIIQITSTDEALLDRRLAHISPEDWNNLQIDVTPREYVMDYLMNSFPVHLYEPYTDEQGNEYSRPVIDSDGNPVFCQEALRQRQELVERLGLLPALGSALDQIVQYFGHENVAEVTGRSKRIVRETKGGCDRLTLQKRGGSANLAETAAFMDDLKQILIFSEAGGTGRSYHADLNAKNQRLRVHYLLEAGWKADSAIQGLGRSNRTNQAQPPVFRPVTTNVKGEKRFLSCDPLIPEL
ncbi:MAG: hypothetical protein N5P05_003006 [Chroococcopsis gigantea SAG 12.99]|jgi:predicted RNA methylase|nr:strawberry notch family protein [Chlorogloea purpurea SAG 13.99]MDV3001400.1 hypothetical protein [Chroococcopsis gigantea SAG 12.99]